MAFSYLGLSKALVRVTAEQHYARRTPIQIEAIPGTARRRKITKQPRRTTKTV